LTSGTFESGSGLSIVLTFLVGITGGLMAHAVSFPAGLMSGSMVAVAVAALCGMRVAAPDAVRRVAYTVLGATIGAGVSQDTLASLPTWPVSLAGLAVSMAVLMMIAPRFLMRVYGFDRKTAVMSSVPGAFSFVIAFSEDVGADVRRVAILQTLRLAGLFVVLPSVIGFVGSQAGVGTADIPPLDPLALALLLGCAVACVPVAVSRGLAAPEFIGSMIAGLLLSGSGAIGGTVPHWLAYPAFVGTGIVIGTRFSGIDRSLLKTCVIAGMGVFAVSMVITGVFAMLVATALSQPIGQIWLAYAPGGLDTMAVLALSLGYDPAFVAGHQLLRFLGLSLILPFTLRRTLDGPQDRSADA